ncbi:16S rRNA (guanine(527)-N(7))-methyltransferase RsmG [Acaryochloris sp. IP29b_bin.148]|uniref:16S rRNA (guanine(527)-N(7))-methyltransferase RsmG n=1 Tax=Acaryochloris sp. IP29b_bin.148 TaxID=2969218 RepID=UPI00260B4D5F|nr:16S rRNA (guanine(527)-N(7))-methyltransferase RsmG [Acaryochloris sp. IP29b_bin.148]
MQEINHAQLPWQSELWEQTLGWKPTTEQPQYQRLFQLVLQANQHLNLTRITDPHPFWEKHLWDSLVGIAPWLPRPAAPPLWLQAVTDRVEPPATPLKTIDIGTGGGFPGLPVAISQPTWPLTLLDSTQKKLTFLAEAIAELGLERVVTCCDRAENLGQSPTYRESFDLALIRAVGPASVCAEYALPLLGMEGYAVLYRGQWTLEEQQGLEMALPQLGGEMVSVLSVDLPLSQGVRHWVYLRKVQPTDAKFPRRVGLPARRPL